MGVVLLGAGPETAEERAVQEKTKLKNSTGIER